MTELSENDTSAIDDDRPRILAKDENKEEINVEWTVYW